MPTVMLPTTFPFCMLNSRRGFSVYGKYSRVLRLPRATQEKRRAESTKARIPAAGCCIGYCVMRATSGCRSLLHR